MNGLRTQPASTQCPECEGKGFLGSAYFDEELEWMIFGKDGKPCPSCEGSGDLAPVATSQTSHSTVAV